MLVTLQHAPPPRFRGHGDLHGRLDRALSSTAAALQECLDIEPDDERDELLSLLLLLDLSLAPLERLDGRERFHAEPAAVELRRRLGSSLLARLRSRSAAQREDLPDGVQGLRRVAALDRVPAVYRWLEQDASWNQLVDFLAVEGGPDAGFDDLVALAQVGVRGVPKVALAANYWDEMGRGEPVAVHTRLHDDLVQAIDMPRIPTVDLPVGALERMALGGVLVVDRALQPEAIGALGLLELQAGPRCRSVVRALRRLHAPAGALPFYEEHAEADPRHGKDWLDRVVAPLAENPDWARRMVDGAVWRHEANRRFFDAHAPAPCSSADPRDPILALEERSVS